MALFVRFFVVAFAFLASCTVATLVVLVAWLVPEIFEMAVDPIDWQSANVMLAVGVFVVSGFALVPALIVILLTEAFSIRSVLAYALAGGIAGVCCYLAFIPFDTATMVFNGIVRRHLEVMVGAGIVGGFVYWLIAGRNAGRWREAPLPARPPALP